MYNSVAVGGNANEWVAVPPLIDKLLWSWMPKCASLMQSGAMPINQWQYNDELADLCGPDAPRTQAWRARLAGLILPKAVCSRPASYRDSPSQEEQDAMKAAEDALQKVMHSSLTEAS